MGADEIEARLQVGASKVKAKRKPQQVGKHPMPAKTTSAERTPHHIDKLLPRKPAKTHSLAKLVAQTPAQHSRCMKSSVANTPKVPEGQPVTKSFKVWKALKRVAKVPAKPKKRTREFPVPSSLKVSKALKRVAKNPAEQKKRKRTFPEPHTQAMMPVTWIR